jgi:hypothetical protein
MKELVGFRNFISKEYILPAVPNACAEAAPCLAAKFNILKKEYLMKINFDVIDVLTVFSKCFLVA